VDCNGVVVLIRWQVQGLHITLFLDWIIWSFGLHVMLGCLRQRLGVFRTTEAFEESTLRKVSSRFLSFTKSCSMHLRSTWSLLRYKSLVTLAESTLSYLVP
jgi:hypothetical protein